MYSTKYYFLLIKLNLKLKLTLVSQVMLVLILVLKLVTSLPTSQVDGSWHPSNFYAGFAWYGMHIVGATHFGSWILFLSSLHREAMAVSSSQMGCS